MPVYIQSKSELNKSLRKTPKKCYLCLGVALLLLGNVLRGASTQIDLLETESRELSFYNLTKRINELEDRTVKYQPIYADLLDNLETFSTLSTQLHSHAHFKQLIKKLLKATFLFYAVKLLPNLYAPSRWNWGALQVHTGMTNTMLLATLTSVLSTILSRWETIYQWKGQTEALFLLKSKIQAIEESLTEEEKLSLQAFYNDASTLLQEACNEAKLACKAFPNPLLLYNCINITTLCEAP